MKRIIVIGGVAGGMSAASQLRRLDQEAEIIVFEKVEMFHIVHAVCRIIYQVL
ncbi:hypothetical protein OC195_19095 [Priestia flexa]|nr:hypothetical protein OC195_19095 [Priestia flexa]